MNFNNAWENKKINVSGSADIRKQTVQARINFDGGTATMVFKKYFENEAENVLHLAWNTYCKNKDSVCDSISSIVIEDVQSISISSAVKTKNKNIA